MLSRRAVLKSVAAAAGVQAFGRPSVTSGAGPDPSVTPVNFDVPAGACDCHTHVIGDVARFPLSPTRTYTPAPASVEELQSLHRSLRIARVVIVNPSVYGTDNRCTLDAMRQLGPSARGIAVVDDQT